MARRPRETQNKKGMNMIVRYVTSKFARGLMQEIVSEYSW